MKECEQYVSNVEPNFKRKREDRLKVKCKSSKLNVRTMEQKKESVGGSSLCTSTNLIDTEERYRPTLPPISPSINHTVLFEVPVTCENSQNPYPASIRDYWDSKHVRMPYSSKSLYPVKHDKHPPQLVPRWELVQEALLRPIKSSQELEAAILSYNSKYCLRWNFKILHLLFSDELSNEEGDQFFSGLLPKMVELALKLPMLVTGSIPLLVQHKYHSISLSQLQIASLLANAFFCTFPRRNTSKYNSEYATYPDINFNRLFQLNKNGTVVRLEKLKCLIHYFRRVCSEVPTGVVTFTRLYKSVAEMPLWSKSVKHLKQFHITHQGTIENEGRGMLQVDFANKLVGGGVLGSGCVQEEIRFVICPELIVTRLFTEELDATEALLITGCERFSNYTGYGDQFEWAGDYKDETPMDCSMRRLCSIVAMDAQCLGDISREYSPRNMSRELNKAFVGFHYPQLPSEKMCAVATGNWGCGAFGGNTHLKALLQLMAAAEAGRNLVYFTFGSRNLCDDVSKLYRVLMAKKICIGNLWNMLGRYFLHISKIHDGATNMLELYPFLIEKASEENMKISVDKGLPSKWLNRTGEVTPSSAVKLCTKSTTVSNDKEIQKMLGKNEALLMQISQTSQEDTYSEEESIAGKSLAPSTSGSSNMNLLQCLDDYDQKCKLDKYTYSEEESSAGKSLAPSTTSGSSNINLLQCLDDYDQKCKLDTGK